MKTNILYFTRTSGTKSVAIKLGKETGSHVYEIRDGEKWHGPGGLIKGLWYSLIDREMSLIYDAQALDAERLIIMSPLWLQGPTPAIKTLLKSIDHDNIYLVMTNNLSPVDGVLRRYMNRYDGIKKTYGITARKKNEKEAMEKLVADLRRHS